MQMNKGIELRRRWEAKGNPHCDHPQLDKEYIEGFDTGDHICTTCGKCFTPSEYQRYLENKGGDRASRNPQT